MLLFLSSVLATFSKFYLMDILSWVWYPNCSYIILVNL